MINYLNRFIFFKNTKMDLLTLILFFIYSFGIGFSLTYFIKSNDHFLERNLIRIGLGLGTLPILGIFLSLIHVPLDWRVFLILSLILPSFYFLKNFNKFKNLKLKITKSDIYIILVLLLFLATFYMYHKGAFAYPYLEDDDPWSHAVGIKYISIQKTVFGPINEIKRIQFVNPYPPGYDILLGILHQTSPSIIWTMKFFNALIISLSIIFFYFFVRKLSGSKKKALFSTFALAMIPSFLSHFIWAIALTVPLYFVAFYCIERIKESGGWIFPSILVIASTLTISPTHSTYFGLFFILYFITKSILDKKFSIGVFSAGFFGLFLSFLVWWLPMIIIYGVKGVLQGLDIGTESVFGISGTGDRPYTLGDFIFAKAQNMINNPIGIGIILSALVIISIFILIFRYKSLIKKENHWKIIVLVWFVFTLYAVNAARFPIKLSAFRTWMLFAIPLCILVSEGFFFLVSLFKNNMIKMALIAVILAGIWFTSGYQKYQLNTTSGWPAGAFWTYIQDESGRIYSPELEGYIWLKDLPVNTKVFSFVNDGIIIGLDKYTCTWCDDVAEFKKTAINKTVEELHDWLKKDSYEYLTIGGQEAGEFGVDVITNKMQEIIAASNLFQPVYQTKGVVIFKVV